MTTLCDIPLIVPVVPTQLLVDVHIKMVAIDVETNKAEYMIVVAVVVVVVVVVDVVVEVVADMDERMGCNEHIVHVVPYQERCSTLVA